jgi:hypothetical protein
MDKEIIIARAKRYKEYLLGWAYIPIQDQAIYEKAYREIYGH